MKISDIDLRKMLAFAPEEGTVRLGQDRMLLFRQDSLGSLRQLLSDQVGAALSRAILTQFGYRCGFGDFQTLSKAYSWDSEQDRMGAGPVLHTWEGIVHAEPTMLEFDRKKGHFHMTGIWRNSYEADLHLRQSGKSSEPVCHTLTGYATGWCSGFFGKDVVAIETQCSAMGDAHCGFEVRTPEAWGPEAEPFKLALRNTDYSLSRELEDKVKTVEQQSAAIRELSTPVIEIWDDILVLPIVGVVDTHRSVEIMNNLLSAIVDRQAKCVIIDVTGVAVVDTKTADYLLKIVRAAFLLGTRCVLTGLSPAVAQTLVEIGADLGEVRTLRNLKEGLKDSLRHLRQSKDAA